MVIGKGKRSELAGRAIWMFSLVTWRRIQGYEESSSSVLFVDVSQG